MGSPPPPDLPPPPDPGSVVSAVPVPTGAAICGFAIPGFVFGIDFKIPALPFDFPPTLFFGIALKCDLSDPLDVDVGFGGGRSPSGPDPNRDPEFG